MDINEKQAMLADAHKAEREARASGDAEAIKEATDYSDWVWKKVSA